jgi:hypothetical protein
MFLDSGIIFEFFNDPPSQNQVRVTPTTRAWLLLTVMQMMKA